MKLVSLISGGIDSPTASFLALSEGNELVCVHVMHFPFNEKSLEKVKKLVKILAKNSGKKIRLYAVRNSLAEELEKSEAETRYYCIICKRFMLRVAEKIALKENAKGIIMGDSLGQVASQTLSNMQSISRAVKIPIIRPLIGMDKIEIEKIARKAETFDVSIIDSASCSCPLLPSNPATKSNEKKIAFEETKINLNDLIDKSVNDTEIIEILP